MTINKVPVGYAWGVWKDSWKFTEGHRGMFFVVVSFFYIINILPSIFLGGTDGILTVMGLKTDLTKAAIEGVGSVIGAVFRVAIAVGVYKTMDVLRTEEKFLFDGMFEGFEVDTIKEMVPWTLVLAVVSFIVGMTTDQSPGAQKDFEPVEGAISIGVMFFYFFSMFVIPLMYLEKLDVSAAVKASVFGVSKNLGMYLLMGILLLLTCFFGVFGYLYLSLPMSYLLFEKFYRGTGEAEAIPSVSMPSTEGNTSEAASAETESQSESPDYDRFDQVVDYKSEDDSDSDPEKK